MKATRIKAWIGCAIFLLSPNLVADPLASDAEDETVCQPWAGDPLEDLYEFEPSRKVIESVERIVASGGGAGRDFVTKGANVSTAAAVICGEERRLYYDPWFFAELGEWPTMAILAHEVGHHQRGHPLQTAGDRKRQELDADDYSGFVICKLGGNLNDARSGLEHFRDHPAYPPLDARLAAVAHGWTRALESDLSCPPEARRATPSGPLDPELSGTLLVDAQSAAELSRTAVLRASWIHFEDVDLVAQQPMILYANRITFDLRSTLRGSKLSLIAKLIEGGTIDAGGSAGDDGGEILVAAIDVTGTTLVARGGQGPDGPDGIDGAHGEPGADGRDARCDWGAFRGSRAGQNGANGADGADGCPGGAGGKGGRIAFLTFRQNAVFFDVAGGSGGAGGAGGKGGNGGPGGKGGAGCFGLGGHNPNRPDGSPGRNGRDGHSGAPGPRGTDGRIWSRPLDGLAELQKHLGEAGGDLSQAVTLLEKHVIGGSR